MRIGTALLAAAAGTSLLAGCGSSRLSHDEFVRKADAVCAHYNAQVKGLEDPRSLAEVESYAERVIPVYGRALDELAALRPPKADEPLVRRWLSLDRRIERDVHAVLAAVRTRRIPSVGAAAARTAADDRRSNALARQLGLKACSRP